MTNESIYIEIYSRTSGWNFRLINESNLGKKVIFSTRQCYEKYSECEKMAKKYCRENTEIRKLKKYYRIK